MFPETLKWLELIFRELKYKVDNWKPLLKESNGNYTNEKYIKWIKNSLDGFNSKLDTAEERINEMEDRPRKTHTEIQKDKNKI